MAKLTRLTESELDAALAELPEWRVVEGKLRREYRFRSFAEAWGFMAEAALEIHALDHHPDWINRYSTVEVELVTHDAGGISARDVTLAGRMEALAAPRLARG